MCPPCHDLLSPTDPLRSDRMKERSFLLLASLVLFSFTLAAQESTVKGKLGGTVYDPSGAVVAKAKVTLVGPTGTRTAISDDEGRFALTFSPQASIRSGGKPAA